MPVCHLRVKLGDGDAYRPHVAKISLPERGDELTVVFSSSPGRLDRGESGMGALPLALGT
jgi:hypothetical protein